MFKFLLYIVALVAILLGTLAWNPKLIITPMVWYCQLFPKPHFSSAGMQALVQLFALSPKTTTIAQLREGMTTFGKLQYVPQRIHVEEKNKAIWITPSDQVPRKDAAILYFHGGGLCAGKAQDELGAAAIFAERTGMGVLSVNYALVPEHSLTDALRDAMEAFDSLKEYKQVTIMGTAGGGGLGLLFLLKLVQQKVPVDRVRAILISPLPVTEYLLGKERSSYESMNLSVEYIGMLDKESLDYLNVAIMNQPQSVKELDELKPFLRVPLPDMLLAVGEYETLRDPTRELASLLKKEGTNVHFYQEPKAMHAWNWFWEFIPESRTFLERTINYLVHNKFELE